MRPPQRRQPDHDRLPDGQIIFLEDVHEEPYRIDRMLTTLSLGGLFDNVAGILFGHCSDCGVKGPSFSLEEILRDRFGSLAVHRPLWPVVRPHRAEARPPHRRPRHPRRGCGVGAGGGGRGGVGAAISAFNDTQASGYRWTRIPMRSVA